jgi:hypothetical protein
VTQRDNERDTQPDRFAYRLTQVLDDGIKDMDAATLQRLAMIRRQALTDRNRAVHGHHVLSLIQRHAGFSALMIAVTLMLAGLWLVQNAQPTHSAETDILLLTGDLPPNAYADQKFSQWLKSRTAF